jgi:hypothetical protein
MIHSKSKSSKIKSEGINDKNSSSNNKTNNVNGNNSTSDSANYISTTKDNLNFDLYYDNNNIEKISNLFYNDENDDKIVNISKLDEDLYSNDKKSKRFDENNKHQIGESDSQILDNNSKIINISNLDIHLNSKNETQFKNENINAKEKANDNKDINEDINENFNNKIHKTEEIKINEIKSGVDDDFKVKKRSFLDKISFRFKIIILISVLLVIFLLTFIILKIILG